MRALARKVGRGAAASSGKQPVALWCSWLKPGENEAASRRLHRTLGLCAWPMLTGSFPPLRAVPPWTLLGHFLLTHVRPAGRLPLDVTGCLSMHYLRKRFSLPCFG